MQIAIPNHNLLIFPPHGGRSTDVVGANFRSIALRMREVLLMALKKEPHPERERSEQSKDATASLQLNRAD
jgi:hypothetical protein